jgi:hypothetical protein
MLSLTSRWWREAKGGVLQRSQELMGDVGYFVTLHEMFKFGLKISKKQVGLLLADMLIIWLSIRLEHVG